MIPADDGVSLRRVEKQARLRGLLKELSIDIAECEAVLAEAKRGLAKVI